MPNNAAASAKPYNPEAIQKEWNIWLKVKEIVGAENYHAISQACSLAAEQFRADQEANKDVPRVAEQFNAQADRCEKIAFYLEL